MENEVEKLQQDVQKLQNEVQALQNDMKEIKEMLTANKGKKKAGADALVLKLDESIFEQYNKGEMTYTEYENKAREDLENKKGNLSWRDCAKYLENETKKSEFRENFMLAVVVTSLFALLVNAFDTPLTKELIECLAFVFIFLGIVLLGLRHLKPELGLKGKNICFLLGCCGFVLIGSFLPEVVTLFLSGLKDDPKRLTAAHFATKFCFYLIFVIFAYLYMHWMHSDTEHTASLTQIAESQAQAQPACPQTFAVQAAEQDKTHAMKVTISPVKSKE